MAKPPRRKSQRNDGKPHSKPHSKQPDKLSGKFAGKASSRSSAETPSGAAKSGFLAPSRLAKASDKTEDHRGSRSSGKSGKAFGPKSRFKSEQPSEQRPAQRSDQRFAQKSAPKSASKPTPKPGPLPASAPTVATLAEQLGESTDFQRLYGKHPVREALTSERPVYKLWLSQSLKPPVMYEFQQLARERQVPVQVVPNQKLNQLLPDLNHQGIMAETGGYDYADWHDWLAGLKTLTEDPFVLVLDQLQDPHNLGAILRTAEAAGVHGVVITRHGGVGLNETVAKASAGAIETVPVLQETNLARCLEDLKAAGLWCMGLSAHGGQGLYQSKLQGPLVLVIGNEHKGLRPNVEKHCDSLLQIPARSERSLNASVAAAVAMYEVVRQRL